MIYLLVQDSVGYDDCYHPVFAHHDKEVVEQVRVALQENFRKWHILAKRYQDDVACIHKQIPRPSEPKYDQLPYRPLVWIDNSWNNAYIIEYDEVLRLHNIEVDKEVAKLKKKYIDLYQVPESKMDVIYSFLSNRPYLVEEIEDDPNVDINTL